MELDSNQAGDAHDAGAGRLPPRGGAAYGPYAWLLNADADARRFRPDAPDRAAHQAYAVVTARSRATPRLRFVSRPSFFSASARTDPRAAQQIRFDVGRDKRRAVPSPATMRRSALRGIGPSFAWRRMRRQPKSRRRSVRGRAAARQHLGRGEREGEGARAHGGVCACIILRRRSAHREPGHARLRSSGPGTSTRWSCRSAAWTIPRVDGGEGHNPKIRVIGVESSGPAMQRSVAAGKPRR